MLTRDRNLVLLIRVGNLILASFFFLAMLMGEAGCHSALSSSPPRLHHGPVTIREIAMDAITLVWFAGAVGLFSRRRLAWIGSLVGVGASACFFGALLGTAVWSCLFPDAAMERLKEFGSAGYAAALVILFGQFSLLLAVSLGLFVGLLRMRREFR
jgi:hypothetical protein